MSDVAALLAQLAARTEPAADPAMAAVRLARATIDALILKLGQTIDAKVTAQLAGGLTQLTAGPETFVLKLATPLPVDTPVTLRIAPTPSGQPSITLTPQQPAVAAPLAPPAPAPMLTQPPVAVPPNTEASQPPVLLGASPAAASTSAPVPSPPPTAATAAPPPPSTSPSPLRGGDRGGGTLPAQPPPAAPAPAAPALTLQPATTAQPAAASVASSPSTATSLAGQQPVTASRSPLATAHAPNLPQAVTQTPQAPAPASISPPYPVASMAPVVMPSPQVATINAPTAPAYSPSSPPVPASALSPTSAAPAPPPPSASPSPLRGADRGGGQPAPARAAIAAPTGPSAPPLAQILANPVQAALQQDSAAPLVAKLASLIASPASAALPRPLLEAIVRVLANRIELDRDPPDGRVLRDAVLRAGVFTEPASRQLGDARSALLQLRTTLAETAGGPAPVAPVTRRPPPPLKGEPARAPQPQSALPASEEPVETVRQLLGHTDAALSRLKLLQLASGTADTRPGAAPAAALEFRVEIPLQLGAETGILQLLVQRDGKHKASPRDRGWRMRFALDFTLTGEVGAEIALFGRAANVALWAAEPATADALEAMLPELAPALARHGLDIGSLRLRRGAPPRPAPTPGQLLDSAR